MTDEMSSAELMPPELKLDDASVRLRQRICEDTLSFLRDYVRQFNEPLKYRVLAQKYGKLASSIGSPLIELYKGDPRFHVTLKKSGAYCVSPSEFPLLNSKIMDWLCEQGGSSPSSLLKGMAIRQGHSAIEFEETLASMYRIGAIVLRGDVAGVLLSLPDDYTAV